MTRRFRVVLLKKFNDIYVPVDMNKPNVQLNDEQIIVDKVYTYFDMPIMKSAYSRLTDIKLPELAKQARLDESVYETVSGAIPVELFIATCENSLKKCFEVNVIDTFKDVQNQCKKLKNKGFAVQLYYVKGSERD